MARWIRFLALMAGCCSGGLWAADLPRPAPHVVFKTPGGRPISVEQFRGKVMLLKFFLTDCPHCQRTATHILPIYREWQSRGLEVLGVAINPDARERISEFAQRFNVTYPLAVGDPGMIPAFSNTSVVQRVSVPYIFMIDRKGNIRYEHPGSEPGKRPTCARSWMTCLKRGSEQRARTDEHVPGGNLTGVALRLRELGQGKQRRIMDARLAESAEDIKKGRLYGPFNTAGEMIRSMKEQLKKRAAAKKAKRSR